MFPKKKKVIVVQKNEKNFGETGSIIEIQGKTVFVKMEKDGVVLPYALSDLDHMN
jgi:hypothetical protein